MPHPPAPHLGLFPAVALFLALALALAPGPAVADSPPVVTAPARVDGFENAPVGFDVTVSEPDGDEILELRAENLPTGATFVAEPSNATARFAWTPTFEQSGTFAVQITARSLSRAVSVSEPIPLEGSATVQVAIANVNRPPIIVPLQDVVVSGGASATVLMLATDPDGTGAFQFTLVSGPSYVIRINAFLYMTPALADTGEADVVYSISDGQAAATGSVHVIVTGAPPCVASPIAIAPPYRVLVDASRDDGLWWAPQDDDYDPGQAHIGKRLADNMRGRGIEVVELGRRNVGVLTSVISFDLLAAFDLVIRANGGSYTASELGAYSCYLANGGRVVLLADGLPTGDEDHLATWLGFDLRGESRGENRIATFAPHPITEGVIPLVYGVGSGVFDAPPEAEILGSLSQGTFIDLNGDGIQDIGEPAGAPAMGILSFGAGLCFFIGDTNMFLGVPQPLWDNLLGYFFDDRSQPSIEQPADMTVRAGAVAEQTLRGSDPDGEMDLIFSRVDGPRYMRVIDTGPATGVIRLTPRLSEVGGTFGIVRVSDGLLEDRKTLRLTVTDEDEPLPARAYLPDGHRTIPLGPGHGAGVATVCVQVEPLDGGYENAAVDPAAWAMVSEGSGARVPAVEGKQVLTSDRDRTGVEEMAVCFRREDLKLLAPALRGRAELPVRIEGALVAGTPIEAPLTLAVVGLGPRQALVTPNPARGSSTLLFHTEAAGPVTIRLFDARGRQVRRIESSRAAGMGYHEVMLDARDSNGAQLPSGSYFYRIDAPEGRTTGRWIVVR